MVLLSIKANDICCTKRHTSTGNVHREDEIWAQLLDFCLTGPARVVLQASSSIA